MTRRSDATLLFARLKDEYLKSPEAHGSRGGGAADGYYALGDKWLDEHPDEERKMARAFAHKTMQAVWHEKPILHDHPQVTIDGFDIPQELVYADPESDKLEYRHIYIDNGATLAHLEWDYEVTQDNANNQIVVAGRKFDAVKAARSAAHGNRSALLVDIADEIRQKEKEPESVE